MEEASAPELDADEVHHIMSGRRFLHARVPIAMAIPSTPGSVAPVGRSRSCAA